MNVLSWLIIVSGIVVLVVGIAAVVRGRGALRNLDRLVTATDEINSIFKVRE